MGFGFVARSSRTLRPSSSFGGRPIGLVSSARWARMCSASARTARRFASMSAFAARSFCENLGLFATLRFAAALMRLRTLGFAKLRFMTSLLCLRTSGLAKLSLMAALMRLCSSGFAQLRLLASLLRLLTSGFAELRRIPSCLRLRTSGMAQLRLMPSVLRLRVSKFSQLCRAFTYACGVFRIGPPTVHVLPTRSVGQELGLAPRFAGFPFLGIATSGFRSIFH